MYTSPKPFLKCSKTAKRLEICWITHSFRPQCCAQECFFPPGWIHLHCTCHLWPWSQQWKVHIEWLSVCLFSLRGSFLFSMTLSAMAGCTLTLTSLKSIQLNCCTFLQIETLGMDGGSGYRSMLITVENGLLSTRFPGPRGLGGVSQNEDNGDSQAPRERNSHMAATMGQAFLLLLAYHLLQIGVMPLHRWVAGKKWVSNRWLHLTCAQMASG